MEDHLRVYINELTQAIGTAHSVWRQLGSTEEQKTKSSEGLFGLLSLATRDFILELEADQSALEVEVKMYKERLEMFQSALGQDTTSLDQTLPLWEQLEELQLDLDDAEALAEERQFAVQQKQMQLEMYHFNLNIDDEEIHKLREGVPPLSAELIQCFEEAIHEASACLDIMHQQIKQKVYVIDQLVNQLQWPEDTLQEEDGEALYCYLDRLNEQHQMLESEKETRTKTLESLLTQLDRYTPYLNEDAKWLETHTLAPENWWDVPLSEDLLKQCKTQVDYAQLRFFVLATSIIERLRSSIQFLWDQLSYEPAMRAVFEQQYISVQIDDSLSLTQIESILEAHEAQEKRLLEEAEKIKPILLHIRQRENAVEERDALQHQIANDKDRFKGRGGNLLKEEQNRKRIQKAIKISEAYLRKALPRWEDDNCRSFIYNERRYLDLLGAESKSVAHTSIPSATPVGKRSAIPRSTPSTVLAKRTALQARSTNRPSTEANGEAAKKRSRLSHQTPRARPTSTVDTAPIMGRPSLSHSTIKARRTTTTVSRRASQMSSRPVPTIRRSAVDRRS